MDFMYLKVKTKFYNYYGKILSKASRVEEDFLNKNKIYKNLKGKRNKLDVNVCVIKEDKVTCNRL